MAGINTVLIVEDDPVQQRVIKAYFVMRKVPACLVAKDGDEAIALLKQHQDAIELITCDLNMPEKDGIEFIGFLKSTESRIPIVIITSAREFVAKSAEMLAKAHGLNFLGVIRKPPRVRDMDKVMAPMIGR